MRLHATLKSTNKLGIAYKVHMLNGYEYTFEICAKCIHAIIIIVCIGGGTSRGWNMQRGAYL